MSAVVRCSNGLHTASTTDVLSCSRLPSQGSSLWPSRLPPIGGVTEGLAGALHGERHQNCRDSKAVTSAEIGTRCCSRCCHDRYRGARLRGNGWPGIAGVGGGRGGFGAGTPVGQTGHSHCGRSAAGCADIRKPAVTTISTFSTSPRRSTIDLL